MVQPKCDRYGKREEESLFLSSLVAFDMIETSLIGIKVGDIGNEF